MANVAPASSAVAARLLLRDGSVVACCAGADPLLNICGCFRSSGDCRKRFNQPCEYEPFQAGNYEPLVCSFHSINLMLDCFFCFLFFVVSNPQKQILGMRVNHHNK
jgi:hypothetical protein